jgi:outer membrane immunogenic protein
MKNAILRVSLIVATAFAVTAANAADLPRPSYKAPAYVADPIFSWTGFYIGANAGYGFGSSSWSTGPSPSPKGFVAGGQLGYNYQYSAFVFGLEADFDYSAVKGDVACGGLLVTCSTKNNYLATGRGRIGYAFDRFLPYFTGGVAFGKLTAGSNLGEGTSTKTGYAIGGGLEYAFSGAWSVRAEYLYVDLGTFSCGVPCGAPSANVSFKESIVRAGVNYRF